MKHDYSKCDFHELVGFFQAAPLTEPRHYAITQYALQYKRERDELMMRLSSIKCACEDAMAVVDGGTEE